MVKPKLRDNLKQYYWDLVNSIAFYPVIIAIGFGMLSFLVIAIESYPIGNKISEAIAFSSTKDPDTARSLLSALIGGMLSLTVFSFSMVMVVLSQAASNYSPKILDSLVKERRAQWVLGFYIGSIVFYIPLLLKISSLQGEQSVFSIGILLSITLAIFNVFLFIYFIAHVSNSIKPNQIIKNIYEKTLKIIQKISLISKEKYGVITSGEIKEMDITSNWIAINSHKSGYCQDVEEDNMLKVLSQNDLQIKIKYHFGEYVLKNSPLFWINKEDVSEDVLEKIKSHFVFYTGESINENFVYGLRQLMEIAIKALSPGINDPGTAKLCINMIVDIISDFIAIDIPNAIYDEKKTLRIVLNKITFEEVFATCFDPIRQYGKEDKSIAIEVLKLINQLKSLEKTTSEQITVLEQHEKLWISDINSYMDNKLDKKKVKEVASQK